MKHLIIKCYRELFVSILLITVYSILVVLAGLSLSFLLNSVASGNFKEFIATLLIVISLWLGMVIIGYLRSLANHKTIYSLNVETKKRIINSIVHKDYQHYKDEKSGTYVSWLTNDSKMIEENVFETLLDLYESLITVILTFVSLFSLHPIIAMSSVTFLVIMILVPSLLQNAITERTNILSTKQEEYSNVVLDLLNGFCEFLNTNKQILLQTKLNKSSYKIEKVKKKFNDFISLTDLLLMFSNVLAQFGLIAISSVLAIMEFAQFGSILAVGNLAGTFYNSSANCVQLLMQYKGNLSLLNKYDYDCKAPNSIEDINIDTLDIKDLTFGYNENVDVLRDFNLHVKKGDKIAIIGESGVGKSTLFKLIMGYYPYQDGSITLNQKESSVETLRNNIGYVMQDATIFKDTVRNNLTLWEEIDDIKIIEALKKLGLWEWVKNNESGLDYIVDETSLSGGQKCRIALARVLLSNKKYILMDEVLSAVDKETTLAIEQYILKNNDLTILYITHHLSLENEHLFNKVVSLSS